ncbi:TonB-dependent receptor [Pontibacter anaerobius]|uniref:TonB-dependent receptor n=1 Tax=Pontibacter anaerobius TaxID=2993940 RepID=A0ABT3RDR1_9BACT|nr:TonB-dependent receptor [Pontibacter anaerobius]MCX2739405.1 TonB-dependent receptor [Pontibacter anaerobius]
MKRLFTTLMLLVAMLQAFAQTTSVTGSVQSGSDKTALPGANVVLTRTANAAKTVTATDGEGNFRFERVAQGQYTLEINYIGFQNFSRTFQVAGAPVNLGPLMLQDGATAIQEVQIIGRAPLGEQKGDTSQFNAKAFKTAPDASAEDLVTKMPGVTVQDGKIQAQGEDVQQVMIDGKRYTGEDVNSAVRNLSADMVESVQVFDGQSDRAAFSGFDDGNRLKTLNFVTKKEKQHGYVGKASAGYGTDERYMLGATVNYFNGSQRITATGLTNNINMFDFSIGETPGGGMRGRRGWGGESPNGIINTNTFGLNYNDMWGKKMEVSGNYNYSNRDVINNQYRFRDFVNSDTTYTENSLNQKITDSHRFNFRLQYNINENNRLLIRPNVTIQRNESLVGRNASTIANGDELTNSINSDNVDNASLNLGNTILYSHRFGDSGRILTTEIETRYTNTAGETYQRENTTNFLDEERNVDRNQFIELDRANFSWSGNLDYSQRLAEKSRLQLEYNISNRDNDSDKRTYDYVEGEGYSEFNSPLSNTFQNNYVAQRFGPSYQYKNEKSSFQLNARYQYATLRGESEFPELYSLKRDFNNVLPSAEYEYKFSKSTNLRINYRTTTNEPSVDQLQDVLDISNPLRPSIGNPSLGQEYQNRLFMRFRKFNAETNQVFFMGIFGTMTQDYITNSIYTRDVPFELPESYTYRPGARFSRPVNLDGYWSVRSFFNYGQPVNFISSNFNVNGSVGYSRTPGMINEEINYANNTNFRVGLNLSSNISEKVDFNVSTSGSYELVENTLNTTQNNNYYNHSSNLRLNATIWKGLVYRTELNHQFNSGLSEGVDQAYLLWNMSLGKKVFKNQQGEISLSVNDLLKQNVSIERNIAADYVEDVQSTVLQRYFMLTFTYNLRKFISGAAPEMNQNRGGNWGGRPGGH